MTNGNDFAFNDSATRLKSATENGIEAHNPPITKREYFAAMAMQGLCANPILKDVINKVKSAKEFDSYTANTAVSLADALINALNETK
jgi:hypothetical protein